MSRIYNNGSRVISGNEFISWTKGFVLDKKERVACAYELRRIRGVEYLFIEWKTGDYIYGGIKPQYYVFIRNS